MSLPRLRFFASAALIVSMTAFTHADTPSDRPSEGSWCIAVIPDTQYYVRKAEDAPLFTEITRWLVEQREKYAIRLALHVGDIVDANTSEQWERAKASMALLDGQIPYVLAVGNHDLGKNASDRSTMLNDYFKISDNPLNERIFGGAYQEGRLENAWYQIRQGGREYVIYSLEFGPRKEVVKWANEIAAQHPQHRGILVTHEFIDHESTLFSDDGLPRRTVAKTKNSPHSYGIGKGGDVHGGEELWEAFVSKHSGIEFVLNGHYKPFERVKPDSDELRWVAGPAISRRTDRHPDGRPVHQMLFNTQWSPRGGEGWVRLLEFLPDGRTVKVWTISPYLERTKGEAAGWPTSPEMRFSLEIPAVK